MRRSHAVWLLAAAMQSIGLAQRLPGLTQPSGTPAAASTAARAEQALREQNSLDALRAYQSMIAANPRDTQAWTGMGVLLYGSGRASEAEDALSHALSLDPSAPRAGVFLALSQADRQECSQALPSLIKYFAAESAGKLQRLIGLTLLQCSTGEKDPSRALLTAAQLRRSYPDDPDVLYEAAELYTRLWSQTADELMVAHPDSYRVHELAGEVNEAQGNLAQAVRQYRAALEQRASLPQMHYRVGQLLLKIGGDDADEKAMAEFREELAINPQSAVAALAMAEINRQRGKLGQADEEYHHALELEPGLPEARIGLAQTLIAEHQVAPAESLLRALLSEYPGNAQAHYALMLACREQGQLAEASTEMATFQRLQQTSADHFQRRLNALLSGEGSDAATNATSKPSQ